MGLPSRLGLLKIKAAASFIYFFFLKEGGKNEMEKKRAENEGPTGGSPSQT